jgi:molecular chaperone GrpE
MQERDRGGPLDDSIKEKLLNRFRAYLDTVDGEPEPPDQTGEGTDLFSVFIELAALRSEVRTESRMVKEALDQFRSVFDALQASHGAMEQELKRAQAEAREQSRAALRPLLLDVIDIRDRLVAGLKLPQATPTRWRDRFWRRNAPDEDAWREGVRMTLRRVDQLLLAQRIAPVELVGRPFDPRLGCVVATARDASVADGTVIDEVRTGFLWEDELLRPAEVIVSKGGADKRECL